MAVPKRLRFEVLRRDNHTCRYCGASAPDVKLTVDHVVPEVLGGTDEPSNLVTACEPCNSGKTSTSPGGPLVEDVRQDAVRWARAMEQARVIRQAHVEARDAYADFFLSLWQEWKTGKSSFAKPVPLDDAWRTTLDKFFEYDVSAEDIQHAVTTAMGAVGVRPENTFRYFCGIVWRIIRELQETAGQIVVANLNDEIYGERD